MRVTSPKGIIAHEITKAIIVAESNRNVPLDLIKRQVIREKIDEYHKNSFGHSLTEFRQIRLEIDVLSEELDQFLAADLPNLTESMRRNPYILKEGAILPTWVNMILPFVGMGADAFLPGTGVGSIIDIVNSLDMFFGATSTFEYILSGLFLVMAIPAVGDALGVGAAPITWIADKVNNAKGMVATVIKKIMEMPMIAGIADKVIKVIQPLLNGFKPGGKVFEFIKNMWNKLPVKKAGEFATKMEGKGGIQGVLGKMAEYLQKGMDSVRKLVGLGVQKVDVALSKIVAGPQVRALQKAGVNSIDDIAKAEASVANSMGKQAFGKVSSATKTLEIQTAKGATKTITSDLGFGIKNIAVRKGADGSDELFVAIHKASGRGSGPGRMGFDAGKPLGQMRSGLAGGSPSGFIPVKNLPQSMIDDLGIATQINQISTIGAARTGALSAGVAPARVAPTIPATTGTATSRAVDAAADVAARARDVATGTAGRARDAATGAVGRARDAATSAAGRARDAAGRAARSRAASVATGAVAGGGTLAAVGAFEENEPGRMVAENRLTSSSAYLDGLVDLKDLLG